MAHLKQIFLAVLLIVIAELTLKYSLKDTTFSASNIPQFFITALTNPFTILGFSLIVLSSVIWIATLSKTDLSYAYPFVSIGYVTVTLLSIFLLKESPSALRIIGAIVISFGIILMSRS
ncbi:EamA family transporter [Candidatus Woesearchaeota archaeon]|nr:EamA family transporter [Candidatus Woesearchaeota archaeon]